jgi:predicted metalloprotease with PDZ domain
VVPLTAEARTRFGLTVASGALVDSVRPGSPAAEAGVLPGAAIVALDGRRIDAPNELAVNVAALRVGQEVEVAYYVGDTMYRKRTMLTAAAADPLAPERRDTAKPPAPGAPAPGALAPSEELSELKRELTLLQSQAEALQRRIAALEVRLAEEKE